MSSSAPTLSRTAFRTSRLLDFVSEKELTLQCGYGSRAWPLVVVKELLDNALDACEEQGLVPDVRVTVDQDGIEVSDNGSGIPPDVVDRLLDFSIRVSSREAYVAPDRGAQGNALKTIVAMPFVLDGEEGRVDIVGGGTRNEIAFCVDQIQQRPVADVARSCETGSLVRVHWPPVAGFEIADPGAFLQERVPAIRQLAADFTFLNPHLSLTVDCFGESERIEATDPGWRKWMPSSPTSPHWYEVEHLERLLGAYVTHDLQNGNRERTVREFVSEFRGLSSTVKQKALLSELGLARAALSSLVDGRGYDHEAVARLLAGMKAQAKPVSPHVLGTLGRSHLSARLAGLGIRPGSFEYKKVATLGDDGLPQVTEVAFAALEDGMADRRLVTGVNWSAAWINPFRLLGEVGRSLDTVLSERRFEWDRPMALLVHVAHPRVQYADRGKSTVVALRSADITQALAAIGRKWTRQVKSEEKRASAALRRGSMYAVTRRSLRDICFEHMEKAWNRASDNGRLPTHWRQVFYVMRPICDDHPDSADQPLTGPNFKRILEGYLADRAPGWDVLRGARGFFKEPHSAVNDNGLPMSTMNVRNYLGAGTPDTRLPEIAARFPTTGATNRIAAVLICEKEGFDEQLVAGGLPARYDLALMSTKGISALAARDLAERVGAPCFTLHDLDKNGFVMAAGFPFATDLGIRLEDVETWSLPAERQHHPNAKKARANLIRNGATQAEADFIAGGRRVELNVLSSADFIRFVEGKLEEHGVEKVIPDAATLARAWERAHLTVRVNRVIRSTWGEGDGPVGLDKSAIPPMPDDLADRIHHEFERAPERSWDDAIARLVDGGTR